MLLSEQEMEEKYNAIRLAIRTDGLTLKERMQHHRSQRDIIETNFHAEADLLQSSLLVIPIARQITPYVYKLLRFNTRMKPIHLENVRRSALETSNTNKLVNN